jgi:RimJ/RimL family protein N-acetyltransferase
MAHVEIRPIEEVDAASYVALLEHLDGESQFLMWQPGERTITGKDVLERLAVAEPRQRLHLVAVCDEVVVAFLVCHRGALRRIQHRCDFTMGVLASHQGRGIGTGLLREMEAWAQNVGVTRIELTVMANNERAIALYLRSGFGHEGNKKGAIRVDGTLIDELLMAKALPAV